MADFPTKLIDWSSAARCRAAPFGDSIRAKNAHNLFIRQNSRDQSRLLKTLLSNCTVDRGSLSATYTKPFDLLVRGTKAEIGWVLGTEFATGWSPQRDRNSPQVIEESAR